MILRERIQRHFRERLGLEEGANAFSWGALRAGAARVSRARKDAKKDRRPSRLMPTAA